MRLTKFRGSYPTMIRRTARKALVVLVLAVAACGTFASTASADKPTREILPTPQFPTLPSDVCGFPIDATVVKFSQVITTFQNGAMLVTGANIVRFTNVLTGRSVVSNQSGPGRFIPNGDGTWTLIGTGRWGLAFFPGQLTSGSPGAFLLTSGPFTVQLTGEFQPIPDTFEHTGATENFCAQLA